MQIYQKRNKPNAGRKISIKIVTLFSINSCLMISNVVSVNTWFDCVWLCMKCSSNFWLFQYPLCVPVLDWFLLSIMQHTVLHLVWLFIFLIFSVVSFNFFYWSDNISLFYLCYWWSWCSNWSDGSTNITSFATEKGKVIISEKRLMEIIKSCETRHTEQKPIR